MKSIDVRFTLRHSGCPTLAAALCCAASIAHAHAPLARAVAVAPAPAGTSAPSVALRVPGFGWALRTPRGSQGAQGFEYICDALLGMQPGEPSEELAPMAFRPDGSLLVGGPRGVRILDHKGCPTPARATQLPGMQIAKLVVHGAGMRAYAATGGSTPNLYRSDDGGEIWTSITTPPGGGPVSGLVVSADDPDTLYVSQISTALHTSLSVSHDAGATFDTFAQDHALTVLHVESGTPARLWATMPDPALPIGTYLLRADVPDGPWQHTQRVNYFGGFAIDPTTGTIWVGDEGGGVYRSTDGGETFDETQPDVATACLTHSQDALWACTPGLPQQPALAVSPDALADFEPVVALSDIDRLIDCSPGIDVATVCAAAWREWQSDARAISVTTSNAGSVAGSDAGTSSSEHPDEPTRPARGCGVAPAFPLSGTRSNIGVRLGFVALAAGVRARKRRHAPG